MLSLPKHAGLDAFDRAGPADLAPRLGSYPVHLWVLRVRASDYVVNRFQGCLSADEVARAARFRFPHLQKSFVLTRGALRMILGSYLDIAPQTVEFTYSQKGKPSVQSQSGFAFNTSHSGDLALFAVSAGCELGVDIEKLRPISDMPDLAKRFFCPAEATELLSLPKEQREHAFFLCWTRKEAYVKAIGDGLSTALNSFQVSFKPGDPATMVHIAGSIEAAADWTLHDFALSFTYAAALAYRGAERTVTVHATLDPVDLLYP